MTSFVASTIVPDLVAASNPQTLPNTFITNEMDGSAMASAQRLVG
jgi:hypothetical protein